MKNFFEEFKKFLNRGNAIELAIGVVIGGAFSNIVNSIVNDILMPIIGIIIGGFDFSSLSIKVGDASINYGNFIQNGVSFIAIAFVLFLIVKATNKIDELAKNKKKQEEEAKPAEDPEDIKLLKSINNELKKLNKD